MIQGRNNTLSTSMGSLPVISLTNDTDENIRGRDQSPEQAVVTMIMDQKGLDSGRDEVPPYYNNLKRSMNSLVSPSKDIKLPVMPQQGSTTNNRRLSRNKSG